MVAGTAGAAGTVAALQAALAAEHAAIFGYGVAGAHLTGSSQAAAEQMARRLAAEEGIFCGISAAGACEVALRVAQTVENATIVFIVCDRGDRYLSTGVFPA